MQNPAPDLRSELVDLTAVSLDELRVSTEPALLRMVENVLAHADDPRRADQRLQAAAAKDDDC